MLRVGLRCPFEDVPHVVHTGLARGGPLVSLKKIPRQLGGSMSARRQPVEYNEATPEVREIYDDIMATRKTDWINNFWKVLAHDPPTLRRIWANTKEARGRGPSLPLKKN